MTCSQGKVGNRLTDANALPQAEVALSLRAVTCGGTRAKGHAQAEPSGRRLPEVTGSSVLQSTVPRGPMPRSASATIPPPGAGSGAGTKGLPAVAGATIA